MSATGFQRRRRELALAAEKEKEDTKPLLEDQERKDLKSLIIEAGLKTAEELEALSDEELIALFQTIQPSE